MNEKEVNGLSFLELTKEKLLPRLTNSHCRTTIFWNILVEALYLLESTNDAAKQKKLNL